jgi:hypothetical protein
MIDGTSLVVNDDHRQRRSSSMGRSVSSIFQRQSVSAFFQ